MKKRRKLRQTSVKSLLLLTIAIAVFANGYRQGDQSYRAKISEFDNLFELVNAVTPDTWESLDGPTTIDPYPVNLTACVSAEFDEDETLEPNE